MAAEIEGITFDLFGTLVHLRRQLLPRALPRLLGIGSRPWVAFVRDELLVRSFASPEELVDRILSRAPTESARLRSRCLELIEEEIESAEPVDGVLSLLAFLKRRGFRLGLLSNLTSVHESVLDTIELREWFDHILLSCEAGETKPARRLYENMAQGLSCPLEKILFVGDSLKNDVLTPRSLGMQALRIGGDRAEALAKVTDLGWVDLEKLPSLQPLVEGVRFSLANRTASVVDPSPLSDREQGRYNLVATARCSIDEENGRRGEADDEKGLATVFVKRFLLPEAAFVEEFATSVLSWVGLPCCSASVIEAAEPCLVSTPAEGVKYDGQISPDVAFEVGRHGAASFIFANGDLRPRNAFLAEFDGRQFMTMLDLEHFFFNLAIDVEGMPDPYSPESFDRLSLPELERRIRRRVLTERATRRAMRSFLELESLDSELGRSFLAGWLVVYHKVTQQKTELLELLRERVYREPYLIIGTHSYRRAMASIDIEDIRERIELDPEEIAPRLVALRRERRARFRD